MNRVLLLFRYIFIAFFVCVLLPTTPVFANPNCKCTNDGQSYICDGDSTPTDCSLANGKLCLHSTSTDDECIDYSGTPIDTNTLDGSSGNSCTARYEGIGYCSYANLKQYFLNGNDAIIASMLCQAESTSNPFEENDFCPSTDYSIGLFQLNAIAHCAGAYQNLQCTPVTSYSKRDDCRQTWLNPVDNIKTAVEFRNGRGNWDDWSTWHDPSHGHAPLRNIASTCGIF